MSFLSWVSQLLSGRGSNDPADYSGERSDPKAPPRSAAPTARAPAPPSDSAPSPRADSAPSPRADSAPSPRADLQSHMQSLSETIEDREIAGLNFREAVAAHMKWRSRLESFIRGESQEDLKVESVSVDNLCVLGKWIHGEGQARFGASPEFIELREEHARFHRCAGGILSSCLSGHKALAIHDLSRGDYVAQSMKVAVCLNKVYSKNRGDARP